MKLRVAFLTGLLALAAASQAVVTFDYSFVQVHLNPTFPNLAGTTGTFTYGLHANADTVGDTASLAYPTFGNTTPTFGPGQTTINLDPGITLNSAFVDAGNINFEVAFNDVNVQSGMIGATHGIDASSLLYSSVVTPTDNYLDVQHHFAFPEASGAISEVYYFIKGNWSGVGTGAGQHQLISIDPELTIIENFTYDSVTDTTLFYATNFTYSSSPQNPVNFRLYGPTPVPEPATLAVLGAGALLAARRRRKQS